MPLFLKQNGTDSEIIRVLLMIKEVRDDIVECNVNKRMTSYDKII